MQLPVNITYRGLKKSEKIDNLVMIYAARLDKFCDHINRCDVVIEQTNHTHHKGNPYRCRIDVTVRPRHELVADEQQKRFARAAQQSDPRRVQDDGAAVAPPRRETTARVGERGLAARV